MDDSGRYLKACFLDFSKAFDRINHSIVVTKLINLGVRCSIIPWIGSFLSNRPSVLRLDNICLYGSQMMLGSHRVQNWA